MLRNTPEKFFFSCRVLVSNTKFLAKCLWLALNEREQASFVGLEQEAKDELEEVWDATHFFFLKHCQRRLADARSLAAVSTHTWCKTNEMCAYGSDMTKPVSPNSKWTIGGLGWCPSPVSCLGSTPIAEKVSTKYFSFHLICLFSMCIAHFDTKWTFFWGYLYVPSYKG